MKVVHVIPGTGSKYYCENCHRDVGIVRGLRERGHEVFVAPMYLPNPLAETGENGAAPPIFYGAVSMYAKHVIPPLRKAPGWIERALDSRLLLGVAGRMSGSTSAEGLEGLTISMLSGEGGDQARELDRLIRWIREIEPDVVHLSNALLMGIAGRVKRELRIPVICSLQDENAWIDEMHEDHRVRIWSMIRERAIYVDRFLPVSSYYANYVDGKTGIGLERMTVVPVGVDAREVDRRPLCFTPPVIGFLAPLTEESGVDLIVKAFLSMKSEGRFKDLRLKLMGNATRADNRHVKNVFKSLHTYGWRSCVDIYHTTSPAARSDFLASLTLLSVPARKAEAFGGFQLEAMANGVPVIQPRIGGFPEVIDATGGGLVYEPNTHDALADALSRMLTNPKLAKQFGESGRSAVLSRFSVSRIAELVEAAYRSCLSRGE